MPITTSKIKNSDLAKGIANNNTNVDCTVNSLQVYGRH